MRSLPTILLLISFGLLAACGGEPSPRLNPLSRDLLGEPYVLLDGVGLPITRTHERLVLTDRFNASPGLEAIAGGDGVLRANSAGDGESWWAAPLDGIVSCDLYALRFKLRAPSPGHFRVEVEYEETRYDRTALEYTGKGTAEDFVVHWPPIYRDPGRGIVSLRIVPPADVVGEVELSEVELERPLLVREVRATVNVQNRRALLLAPRATVAWKLTIPENSRLRFGAAFAEFGHTGESDGSDFAVKLRWPDGSHTELWRRYLAPGHISADQDWIDVDLDLAAYAGREAEILFESFPSPRRPNPFVAVEHTTGDAPLFSAPTVAVIDQERPNVLVILIDSLRAKSLGIYGAGADPSPHIDAFAAESTIFDWAMSTSPWTVPSTASLFTGLLPEQHGVGMVRGGRTTFLSGTQQWDERFKQAGYATAAVTNNGLIRPIRGFGLATDQFDERALVDGHNYGGERMSRYAIQWLKEHAGEPFFLYAHYFDPHWRYQAPPPYTRSFVDPRLKRQVQNSLLRRGELSDIRDALAQSKRRLDVTEDSGAVIKGYLQGLYDGEVRYCDEAIGELLDYLERSGLLANTLVIITADHGEEFAEHGYLGHGHTLYDELIHIPLIIRFPDGTARGERIATPVSNRDLAATVLGYAGLPFLENELASQNDLHAALRDDRLAARGPIFASGAGPNPDQALPEHGPMQSIVDWPWKLIHNIESDRYELYRLDLDPLELDLTAADAHPELLDRYREQLQQAMLRPENWQEGVSEMTPELEEQLRALGYAQ